MIKEEIIKILQDWNLWKKDIEIGVKRGFYLKKLKNMFKSEQVITITGARRSGKSFIMKQLAKDLVFSGVEKNRILIINFEDPRFPKLDAVMLQKIYEIYLEFFQPKEKPYLFLDEIQEVKDWEKWILSLSELQKARIILSGSNAKLLSKELGTLLTGRHLDLVVFPTSFKEFLIFKNVHLKDKLDFLANEIKIKNLLMDYFENGSFPEAVLRENKKEILLTYFNDILEKDLIKRYKIRKSEKLKELLRFYFSNTSCLITFNSLEKSFGISADTIEKFSEYFENAYLLFFVKRFSYKVKEQGKSPRKVYAIDTGLVNVIGFKFSQNLGKLAENIVFLELFRKKIQNLDIEIFYWKNKQHKEVDFVVKKKNLVDILIQVCWNIEEIKTKKREIEALLLASKELKCNNLLVITSDYENEEIIKGKKIKFIPLWKWLLD